MFPRLVFVFLTAVLALFIAGCHRVTDADIVGNWRFEDDSGIEELTLNTDHSFSALQTIKEELSTPSVFEDRGTWRLEGNRLTINAASVYTHADKRRTGVMDSAGFLLVKTADGTKDHRYQRFTLPKCESVSVVAASKTLSETQLIGFWRMHYNTHDYAIRLAPKGEITLFSLIHGVWDPLLEGRWQIDGARLSMHTSRAGFHSGRYEDRAWSITAIGKDCFSAQNDESDEFSLERRPDSEFIVAPSSAFASDGFSPPPTETPSPTR